jgi:hypothetical protein
MIKKIIIISCLLSSNYLTAMEVPMVQQMVRTMSPRSGAVVHGLLDNQVCAGCNRGMSVMHALVGAGFCISAIQVGPIALLTGASCCYFAGYRHFNAQELEDEIQGRYNDFAIRNCSRILFAVSPRVRLEGRN